MGQGITQGGVAHKAGGHTGLGDSQRSLRQLLLGEVQGVIECGDAVGMVGEAWWQVGA